VRARLGEPTFAQQGCPSLSHACGYDATYTLLSALPFVRAPGTAHPWSVPPRGRLTPAMCRTPQLPWSLKQARDLGRLQSWRRRVAGGGRAAPIEAKYVMGRPWGLPVFPMARPLQHPTVGASSLVGEGA